MAAGGGARDGVSEGWDEKLRETHKPTQKSTVGGGCARLKETVFQESRPYFSKDQDESRGKAVPGMSVRWSGAKGSQPALRVESCWLCGWLASA